MAENREKKKTHTVQLHFHGLVNYRSSVAVLPNFIILNVQ